jgi:hypothetical protein
MEPFDEPLDKNIWSLSDKRLKLDQEIAVKRRSKPQEVEESTRELYQRQRAADAEISFNGDEVLDTEVDEDREYLCLRFPGCCERVGLVLQRWRMLMLKFKKRLVTCRLWRRNLIR